ncbi:MAG TPA: Ni/Fe-hydrogenase cytochrome b subunit [bacterium]|nr:MAG: putative Ni/Fe-hydrogenase 2 b-type cytochrome subunit [bacterium ADurb.Bin236]HOY62300.1 Ni/Fe-hydrogenase cytochrome b subunit [bacterium]HPI76805.1 Ni/Fe-hydrogenase cytochrome b subunit [bacterium]HPN93910.1 Ni/Fe-hydrogenase cytochrome b subunit [bacterium]
MSGHSEARPIEGKFFTPGTLLLVAVMAVGAGFAAYRYALGLGPASNLSHDYPWGIWKAINVAAIAAIGSSGFTLTAIVHVVHKHKYHVMMRPGLVLALLSYTFVGVALVVDLGKYYVIWHPVLPSMWQVNSALFEVAMCVMSYLTVLYIEFAPILFKRFIGKVNLPGPLKMFNGLLEFSFKVGDTVLGRLMSLFMILGIVLCTLHQQTLGTIMVIPGPEKVHGLWWTPLLPVLFYLSAIAVGLAAAVAASLWTSKAFGTKYEMQAVTPFSRALPLFIGAYIALRVVDLALRGNLGLMFEGTYRATAFQVEFFIGVCLPFVLTWFEAVRKSPRALFFASFLFILGVSANRVNTYITSFMPPNAIGGYFPTFGEIMVCAAQCAAILFLFRLICFIFPIVDQPPAHAK